MDRDSYRLVLKVPSDLKEYLADLTLSGVRVRDLSCNAPYFHTTVVPFKRLNNRLMIKQKSKVKDAGSAAPGTINRSGIEGSQTIQEEYRMIEEIRHCTSNTGHKTVPVNHHGYNR